MHLLSSKKRKVAVVGRHLNNHLYDYLKDCGWELFDLPENKITYRPVGNHPDLYGCKFELDKWVLEPTLYIALEKTYGPLNKNHFICGDKELGAAYPETCLYNHLVFDGTLMGNQNSFDPQVIILAKKSLLKTLAVKQGYIRCTTALIGKQMICTSDRGIEVALRRHKSHFDVLYIEPEGIHLDGFQHGFLGGCLLEAKDREIYAYGDISKHKQFQLFEESLKSQGMNLIYAQSFSLEDIGSVLLLEI